MKQKNTLVKDGIHASKEKLLKAGETRLRVFDKGIERYKSQSIIGMLTATTASLKCSLNSRSFCQYHSPALNPL